MASNLSNKTNASMLVAAVLLLAGACCFLAFTAGDRGENTAIAGAATYGSYIRSVAINASVTPNQVTYGESVSVAASVSIRGGPGPVTFSAVIPDEYGGVYEGSVTVMVDNNGTYGFDLPIKRMTLLPGAYTYSFTASANEGRVTDTKSVRLVVDPIPEP